ncbi:MAG: GNAT family N-acetyltransferase [Anaerolineae bacterium]|nr:GNAT family N-acetyltransferase [Anaerolineae bacterium]
MTITFERALAADVEMLVLIQIASFHYDSVLYPGVEIGGPPGYDSAEHTLKVIEEDEYYKIILDRQCVGGLVVFDMGEGHCHLDLICIDPAYQNRGIGTQAMAFIEQMFPATRWTLDTPQWAVRNQHFYEKLGYIKRYEFQADDGTPLIAYEKQMRPVPNG